MAGRPRSAVPEPVVHVQGLLAERAPTIVRDGATTRQLLTVAAYRLAVPLAAAVPPDLAYPILDRLADLIRLTATDARQAVEENLETVLGGGGHRHAWAVRGVFRHSLRNYYDTF